jgi:hypothetical protein
MGRLTAAHTKRAITSVEVVSNDSLRVLRFVASEAGHFDIDTRDATESEWSFKTFATLGKEEAEVIATILSGGTIGQWSSALLSRIEGIPTTTHNLPKPEEAKDPMSGDCTPLDIERAKAENLREAKELIQLEMERDHALDRHVGADVTGCPACDRKVLPKSWDDPEPAERTTGDVAGADDIPF